MYRKCQLFHQHCLAISNAMHRLRAKSYVSVSKSLESGGEVGGGGSGKRRHRTSLEGASTELEFARIRLDSPGFSRIREDSLGFAAIREDSLGFARIPKNSLVLRFSHPPNERSARAKRGRGATSLMPSSRLSWSPVVSPQTLFISLRDSLARIRLSNK